MQAAQEVVKKDFKEQHKTRLEQFATEEMSNSMGTGSIFCLSPRPCAYEDPTELSLSSHHGAHFFPLQ